MTFPVEIGRWLDLQLGSLQVPADLTATLQLKEILDLDRSGHRTHNVGLLTIDITLDDPIGPDHHLGRAVDVTYQASVNTQVSIAGNIALHRSPGPDKAGAGARRGIIPKDIRFGFSIEHSSRF